MSNPQAQILAINELKKRGLGFGDAALSIASGAAAEPIAGLAGLSALLLGAGHGQSTDIINNITNKLSYQPRTTEGRENLDAIGNFIQPLAEGFEAVSSGAGDFVYDNTGSEALASAAYTAPTAALDLLTFKTLSPFLRAGKKYGIRDIASGGNKQRGSFGGVKAANADLAQQAAAEELARRGVDADKIWNETGWFKGADNKWRFEIDDSGAQFNMPERSTGRKYEAGRDALDLADRLEADPKELALNKELTAFGGSDADFLASIREKGYRQISDIGYSRYPLTDVLTHNDLYKSYPSTESVTTQLKDPMHKTGASYTPSENLIKLSKDATENVPESALVHETQHIIQDKEGFARGGSVDQIKKEAEFDYNYLKDTVAADEAAALNKAKRVSEGDSNNYAINQALDSLDKTDGAEWVSESYKKGSITKEEVLEMHYLNQTPRYNENYKTLSLAKSNMKSGLGAYKRLAGEAEARLVQKRLDMTEAERKAYPPNKHLEDMLIEEGLDINNLIIRY